MALSPSQLASASGWVKYPNTTEGSAAIWIESRYGSVATSRLYRFLQPPQPGGPEVCQKLLQGLEAFRIDDVQAPFSVLSHFYQAGLGQDLEVLRDRLLADVEVLADFSCGARLVPHEAQNGLSPGLGKCAKDGFTAHPERLPRPDGKFKS